MITEQKDPLAPVPASGSDRALKHAGFRHEICDAAGSLDRARALCWGVLRWLAVPVGLACCMIAAGAGTYWPLALLGMLILCGILVFPIVALGAASLAAYRRLWREQLRRRLARLPEDERAAVLLPLRKHGDLRTRQIVEPLIHDLIGKGGELIPCAAPAGDGKEMSAPPAAGELP